MNSFKPNKLILECIEKKNIKGLRATVTGILVRDRNASTGDFEKNVNYIINECGITELFEDFDGNKPLISESVRDRKLTDEDFSDAIYYLKNNFCSERIDDVINIGRELYPKTLDEYEEEENRENRFRIQKKKEKVAKYLTIIIVCIIFVIVVLKILENF